MEDLSPTSSPLGSPRGAPRSPVAELHGLRVPTIPAAEAVVTGVSSRSEEPSMVGRVRTLGSDEPDMVARSVRVGLGEDGLHIEAAPAHPMDLPYDEADVDQYVNDVNLTLGNRSDGSGLKRTVGLTKKSDDKDETERVPDEKRQGKLKVKTGKLKHALGLTKDYVIEHYGLGSQIIIIKHKDGRFIGKFNLRDLGLLEPDGPIVGGGGLIQLFRITNPGTIFSKAELEAKRAELNKINQELREIVEPETGKKFRGDAGLNEAMGAAEGHRPLQHMSGSNAHKLLSSKDGGLNHKTLESLGHVDRSRISGRRTRFTFNPKGKAAFEAIARAHALQEILLYNLGKKIDEKTAERNPLLPRSEGTAAELDRLDQEIRQLESARKEIFEVYERRRADSPGFFNMIARIRGKGGYEGYTTSPAVVLPILLLHQEFKIKVYELDATGEHVRERDGTPKMIEKRFTFHDIYKSRADMADPAFKQRFALADDENLDAFRNKLIRAASEQAVVKLKELISVNNPHRSFPKVWNVKDAKWQKQDDQLVTDAGGIIHQMLARPSSEPSFLALSQFVESQEASKLAKGSRAAAFLGFSALNKVDVPVVPEDADRDVVGQVRTAANQANGLRLRGFAEESDVVREVFLRSLNHFDARVRDGIRMHDADKKYSDSEVARRYQQSVAKIRRSARRS